MGGVRASVESAVEGAFGFHGFGTESVKKTLMENFSSWVDTQQIIESARECVTEEKLKGMVSNSFSFGAAQEYLKSRMSEILIEVVRDNVKDEDVVTAAKEQLSARMTDRVRQFLRDFFGQHLVDEKIKEILEPQDDLLDKEAVICEARRLLSEQWLFSSVIRHFFSDSGKGKELLTNKISEIVSDDQSLISVTQIRRTVRATIKDKLPAYVSSFFSYGGAGKEMLENKLKAVVDTLPDLIESDQFETVREEFGKTLVSHMGYFLQTPEGQRFLRDFALKVLGSALKEHLHEEVRQAIERQLPNAADVVVKKVLLDHNQPGYMPILACVEKAVPEVMREIISEQEG